MPSSCKLEGSSHQGDLISSNPNNSYHGIVQKCSKSVGKTKSARICIQDTLRFHSRSIDCRAFPVKLLSEPWHPKLRNHQPKMSWNNGNFPQKRDYIGSPWFTHIIPSSTKLRCFHHGQERCIVSPQPASNVRRRARGHWTSGPFWAARLWSVWGFNDQ